MKKYLILILLISNSVFCFSQIDKMTESEVRKLICSDKWYMEYTIYDGEKEFIPKGEVDWVVFHENGEHEYTDLEVYVKGIWTYNHEKKIIITDDDGGIVEHYITILSETELEVKQKDINGFWIMAFNKVEIK